MQDFEDKEYNIKKKDKGYWELGRLGPDLETEELQAKVWGQRTPDYVVWESCKHAVGSCWVDNQVQQLQCRSLPC